MLTEQNKAIVRRFYKAFETNDTATLDEVLAPEFSAYIQSTSKPENREEHLKRISAWSASFGEAYFKIEEQLAEGDTVATRVSLQAVHNRGDFMGIPPSGKQIAISATTIERIKDGRIVERRIVSDWLGMFQQLGILPQLQAVR